MSEKDEMKATAILLALADAIMGRKYAEKVFSGEIDARKIGNDLYMRMIAIKFELKLWRITGCAAAIIAVIKLFLEVYRVG